MIPIRLTSTVTLSAGDSISGQGTRAVVYTVLAVDAKGFSLLRPANAKGIRGSVRITWAKVQRFVDSLNRGETRAFQGNWNAGGLDGTSAIRDGILAALGGWAIRDGNTIRKA